MKIKTKDLSTQATTVYSVMLDLNWSEPFITLDHIQKVTGIGRRELLQVLTELISASKVLHGNEEALGELIETFTPMVKGVAYGYPLDFFKGYNDWMQNKL